MGNNSYKTVLKFTIEFDWEILINAFLSDIDMGIHLSSKFASNSIIKSVIIAVVVHNMVNLNNTGSLLIIDSEGGCGINATGNNDITGLVILCLI